MRDLFEGGGVVEKVSPGVPGKYFLKKACNTFRCSLDGNVGSNVVKKHHYHGWALPWTGGMILGLF